MAVFGGKMEAPAALKWPLAVWGNERKRERERERERERRTN